jgi:L-gulono-1,4-lactone dehydrogenase
MTPRNNFKWENHIAEQSIIAEIAFSPSEVDQIRSIVISAEARNKKVRAVGSGHSWSDICLNKDFIILPENLSGELPLEETLLNNTEDFKTLVRIKSGTTIRTLNQLLEKKGLALPYLGGFDGQTIAGVNATSTHGSAVNHGPIYETILSYDIVGSEGKVYRIERTKGITNIMAFKLKHPSFILIQDDHYYNAVSVNVGCLGVIYSVMIKTVSSFWLKEERPMSTWAVEKERLIQRTDLDTKFHFELLVNPYAVGGERKCLRTIRTIEPPLPNETPKDRSRNFLVEFLSWINRKGAFNAVIGWFKKDSANMINNILEMMKDKKFKARSFQVFHIGEANYVPSHSSELALSMKHNLYLDAIEKMFEIITRLKEERNIYFTGPIALRFVRKAEAYLSPMYGENTCMIELILPRGAEKSREIYIAIEKALLPFGARLHWGQYHFINANDVANMYPKLNEWKDVSNVLNATGVFDNNFSYKMGLNNSKWNV